MRARPSSPLATVAATAALLALLTGGAASFSARLARKPTAFYRPSTTGLLSSFVGESSDYTSSTGDSDDDFNDVGNSYGRRRQGANVPSTELKPVPLSKNAGNRFVAFVWGRELDTENRGAWQLHNDQTALTETHILFCRKANLYNETFNQESMVDVFWSNQILASDLKRAIGQLMFLESTELHYVKEFLAREPIINAFTGGDISKIPLYRWRHIRDFSLRIDDGRFGYSCMCLALDHDPEEVGNLREEVWEETLKYLILSEKVIATGPLHLATVLKDDPSSLAVGDLILFNAKDRDHAIEFAENLPSAKAGLYKEMRVHFYNRLDVTGKFVTENKWRPSPSAEMKEAFEVWGYPVGDDQTPWLNW